MRRGIVSWLSDHGFGSLEEWENFGRDGAPVDAALISLADESDWTALADLSDREPQIPWVALLPRLSAPEVARALQFGADGALGFDASLDEILEALCATAKGLSVVPASVMHQLAAQASVPPEDASFSVDERRWLTALAAGTTVSSIAEASGYSERQMYRLITRLYFRMGAANRAEALVLATRWGVLNGAREDDPSRSAGSAQLTPR